MTDRTELRRLLDEYPKTVGLQNVTNAWFELARAAVSALPSLLDQLDAAEAALARARKLHDDWMEQANFNSEQGGDFWRGMTVKGRDCADGLRRALDGGEQS